jgi:hypothetical protein
MNTRAQCIALATLTCYAATVSHANTAGASSVCGIGLGRSFGSLPSALRVQDTGADVTYVVLNRSAKGKQYYVHLSAPCDEIRPGSASEVPDLILGVVSGRVVDIRYRPSNQDVAALRAALVANLGAPSFEDADTYAWETQGTSRRVLLTHYSGDGSGIWLSIQQFEMPK